MNHLRARALTLLVALLMCGAAEGTVLTSADLPYTTVANNETITFGADSVGSATNGITVNHTGVTIDGDRGGGVKAKLQFGITTGSAYYGIKTSTGLSGNANFLAKNLRIVANNPSNTSVAAFEIQIGYFHTIQDCQIWVHGDDAQGIKWNIAGSVSMLLVKDVEGWDSSTHMTDRSNFTGSFIHANSNPGATLGTGGRIYDALFERVNIRLCPQQGIVNRGSCFMRACTVKVSTQNTDANQIGNGYATFFRGCRQSSDPANYPIGMDSCWIGADTTVSYRTNYGSRGMHIHGNTVGSASYPFFVRHSTIFGSLGPIGGGNSSKTDCIRMESEGGFGVGNYIDIAYNTLTCGGDDDAGTTWRGNEPVCISANFAGVDDHIAIHDNAITAYAFGAVGADVDETVCALRVMILVGSDNSLGDVYDSTITCTNNNIRIGIPLSSSWGMLFEGNTITKLPSDSCATNTGDQNPASSDGPCVAILGLRSTASGSSAPDTGTWYLSNTFSGISSTDIIEENNNYPYGNAHVGLRHHTIVLDGASDPVVGADVYYIQSPYTIPDDIQYHGVTDASGEVIGIVEYYRETQYGWPTSTESQIDYNPFKILAIKGADKDSLNGTTLTSTTTTTYLTVGAGTPPAGAVKSFKGASMNKTRVYKYGRKSLWCNGDFGNETEMSLQ